MNSKEKKIILLLTKFSQNHGSFDSFLTHAENGHAYICAHIFTRIYGSVILPKHSTNKHL